MAYTYGGQISQTVFHSAYAPICDVVDLFQEQNYIYRS